MSSAPKRTRRQAGMSWDQMRRADTAALRDEFRRTTPGERVEELIRLCDFANEVAAAGARARSRGD